MKKLIHRSEERGTSDLGWLQSRFSFSFADYYNPDRMGFGRLRVLNDDTIAAGQGFGEHPHGNMEIITIPTEGILAHKDSTGSEQTIKPGQVQVMSAGSGLTHSEYAKNKTVKLFQIWIEPKSRNQKPRYDTSDYKLKKNELTIIVTKDNINQDAILALGKLEKGKDITYKPENGVFIFVIEGKIEVEKETLDKRDSIEMTQAKSINIRASEDSFFMMIEVPV